ncbi:MULTISPECIES: methylaspartate mutase subunit E [Halobacterium]|uniref:methylaspartate mutase subunit E n=1 Tax=Halobacterium TaxID=2239 RepID=UPI001964DFE2|nr:MULTISPECIES: methylaspartate mutase subunit E [Halobacterium]MCF2164423.1 methylaspartate mutase subunit E [Halobacterium salinarum]MCF2167210.1 methylaspartate mutase subunit E [Halobacterium salinarum]MCF2207228.1 methylaspartate mutase subunit E [Halobacterium salinarum]MCF2238474.1 methylaspartate mutase subunit E [Halobacterium salinarum]MCF2242029.1 methylaspartate mutase subunit E [Halobacterium salinarum]
MIEDKRLTDTELEAITDRITGDWVSRAAVDFADAVAFHESLPPHKRFAAVLENAEAVLCQPRAGVPRLDEHVELLQHLDEEGGADLLPTTIDSYTRDNAYEKAAEGLARSREADSSELNGFPAVNHGVEGCREVVRRVDAPVQVRHGTPDARLLAAVTLAGGFQSFEGGPITYNLPYTSAYDLETTIEYWQYVDRLCGAYTERGVTINREPFGPLTGTLVPPSIAIAIVTIEGLLAATQGVRSVTLGYGQVGNLVQDVAAVRAMAAIGAEYLPDSVTVTTVLHQWMGGFPRDEARAHGVIGLAGATAALVEPTKVITKSPQEAVGVPTAESNAAGLRTTEQVLRMLDEQSITLDGVDREQALIERSVRSLLDAVYEAGDGDIARGTVRAFDAGTLDIPFPPSDAAAGDVLPARDDDGRVRLLKFGAVALDDETKRIHRARLDRRADTEGRELSFRMVADDVSAVSDGRLIGRPGDD